MRFKSTKWLERYYKVAAAVAVVLATIGCCIWFLLCHNDKNISFFAPLMYALFLYLVGVFTNRIASNISSSLSQKAEIYKNLKKVEELANSVYRTEYNDLSEIRDAIIWIREFTERTGKNEIDRKPYISNLGISVDSKYIEAEQQYLDAYNRIQTNTDKAIRQCVEANGIKSKTPYFNVGDSTIFEPEEWCKATFDDYIKVLDSIYNSFSNNKNDFVILDDFIILIKNYICKLQNECRNSIQQIKHLYGDRLSNYLEQEKWHYSDIEHIKETISEVESNISQQISEIQKDLRTINCECNDINRQIETLINCYAD